MLKEYYQVWTMKHTKTRDARRKRRKTNTQLHLIVIHGEKNEPDEGIWR